MPKDRFLPGKLVGIEDNLVSFEQSKYLTRQTTKIEKHNISHGALDECVTSANHLFQNLIDDRHWRFRLTSRTRQILCFSKERSASLI